MQNEKEKPTTRTNTPREDINDEIEERTKNAEEAGYTYPNKKNKDATPRAPEEKVGDKEGLGSSMPRDIDTTEKKDVAAGPIPSTPNAKQTEENDDEDKRE